MLNFVEKSITIREAKIKLANNHYGGKKKMKNSFKKLVTLFTAAVMALAVVAVPSVSAKATEVETPEAGAATQGVITCVDLYDWNFGSYNDIIAFMSLDETQTMGTLTGQADEKVFGWFCSALLEYDEAKGAWVVTDTYLEPVDGPNPFHNTALGEGKMVLMFHGNVTKTQQESYDFFMANLVEGKELYLGVDPSVMYDLYDYVDGAFLSTVPVEVEPPVEEDTTTEETEEDTTVEKESEKEDKEANKDADKEADKEEGMNPILIVAIVVVVVAVIGVIVVVAKRKK